jgi:hypothetical protein
MTKQKRLCLEQRSGKPAYALVVGTIAVYPAGRVRYPRTKDSEGLRPSNETQVRAFARTWGTPTELRQPLRLLPLIASSTAQDDKFVATLMLALPLPFRRGHPDVPLENASKMASVRESGFEGDLRYASCIEA